MKSIVLAVMVLFSSFSQAEDFNESFGKDEILIPIALGSIGAATGIVINVVALTMLEAAPELTIPVAALAVGVVGSSVALAGTYSLLLGLTEGTADWIGL